MNRDDGIDVCKCIYFALSGSGFFPALTGGLLYKEGERKDCDIVIYRHRQDVDHFETIDLEEKLKLIGFTDFKYFGFVTKAKFKGFSIDIFNPETNEGENYEQLDLIISSFHNDDTVSNADDDR